MRCHFAGLRFLFQELRDFVVEMAIVEVAIYMRCAIPAFDFFNAKGTEMQRCKENRGKYVLEIFCLDNRVHFIMTLLKI